MPIINRFIRFGFIKINIKFGVYVFDLRKKLFGFEFANSKLHKYDKHLIAKILIKNKAGFGSNVDFETNPTFHNTCTKDFRNIIIGDDCHIGKNCFFDLKEQIIIEHNSTVSMGCTFITHLDVGKSNLIRLYPFKQGKIILRDNVYVGANSTLLMGIEIGSNSIIASGSVVTKTFPPNSLIGGIPARLIKEIQFKNAT